MALSFGKLYIIQSRGVNKSVLRIWWFNR